MTLFWAAFDLPNAMFLMAIHDSHKRTRADAQHSGYQPGPFLKGFNITRTAEWKEYKITAARTD